MDFWKVDQDVVDMANAIIKEFRPELSDANIVYYFKEKAGKKGGKAVLASAKKISPKDQVVHDSNVLFAIEIAADAWQELAEIQKKAVLHHELCHCGFEEDKEGSLNPSILPHDVEEFSAVVDAHGYYLKDIQDFVAKILDKDEKDSKS